MRPLHTLDDLLERYVNDAELQLQATNGVALSGTYVFVVVESVEHIVRQTGEEIDDEPTFEVIHADDFWIGDHFTARSDKGGVEVEDDVDEEDDVNDRIDHK